MKTPMPVQLENWLKILDNKKTPYDLRQMTLLHLKTIRDTLDESLRRYEASMVKKDHKK